MNSLKRYRVIINPKTGFSGELDSIKIYGALIRAISELYDEAEPFIQHIKNGEFRVSSPMPMQHDTFYMPKPMLKSIEKIDYKDFKKFKKRRFIKEEYALIALKDGNYSPELISRILEDRYAGIISEDLPGVFVSRNMRDTQIFYKNVIYFTGKFWIMIEMKDELEKKVRAAVRYLEDMGLSKKRSSGFGAFDASWSEDKIEERETSYKMFISKYIPNQNELTNFPFEKSRFDIKLISGYTRNGSAIPPIRTITEGSVYPAQYKNAVRGRVVDVYDNYSVVGVPVIV